MRWKKFIFTHTAVVYIGELIGGDFLETLTPQKLGRFLGVMIVIALMAAGLVIAIYYSHFAKDLHLPLSASSTDWGTFGDYVGGTLNPFLAFLSFLALVFTLLLQARQLEMSREELHLARDERREATRAQQKLNETADKQLVETKMATIAQMEAAEALKLAAEAAQDQSEAAQESAAAQRETAHSTTEQIGFAKRMLAAQLEATQAAKRQADLASTAAKIAGLQAGITNLSERIQRGGQIWSGSGDAPWVDLERRRAQLEVQLDLLTDSLSAET